jgi:hypothetical protein
MKKINDTELKKIFEAHKVVIQDDGFSERIINQLSVRKSILPQIVMITFILIGMALIFVIQDFTPVLEQIENLVSSIIHTQIPSLTSIFTYISALAMIGFIGFSASQVDVR